MCQFTTVPNGFVRVFLFFPAAVPSSSMFQLKRRNSLSSFTLCTCFMVWVYLYTRTEHAFFSRDACLHVLLNVCFISLVPNDTCDFEIHIGMSIRTGKKLTTTATTKDTKTEYHKTLTSDENEYEFAAKLSTVSHSFFQPLFLFQFSEWMFYWQLNNSQFTMDCCMLFGPTKNKVESQRISIFCGG